MKRMGPRGHFGNPFKLGKANMRSLPCGVPFHRPPNRVPSKTQTGAPSSLPQNITPTKGPSPFMGQKGDVKKHARTHARTRAPQAPNPPCADFSEPSFVSGSMLGSPGLRLNLGRFGGVCPRWTKSISHHLRWWHTRKNGGGFDMRELGPDRNALPKGLKESRQKARPIRARGDLSTCKVLSQI